MKTFIVSAFLTFSVFSLTAQDKGIVFEHSSFEEIKAKAKKENKLIFVDAYTVWCGPCKQMAKNIFTDKQVADFYNKTFVNAKIDMEKGEGIELAKTYDVNCYPNLLFIDGDGKLIHRIAGSMQAADFISLGNDALTQDKTFSYYASNYEKDKDKSENVLAYIEARESTCLESTEIAQEYLLKQKETDLFTKTNWNIILNYVTDFDGSLFKFVIDNKQKLSELYPKDVVIGKIESVSENKLHSLINSKNFDEKLYNDTKEKILTFNIPNAKQLFFESDLKLAKKQANWNNYTKLANEHVDNFYLKNADALNDISWTYYEKIDDKTSLLKAEKWAKTACDLKPEYPFMDTYAAILYKLGKKDLALTTANKAIQLAKKENYSLNDYQGTLDLIEKIKVLK